jgi:hypothetical protein
VTQVEYSVYSFAGSGRRLGEGDVMLNLGSVRPWTAYRLVGFCSLMSAVALSPQAASRADSLPTATYSVHHALTVKGLPAGTRKVRLWFWLPQEDEYQRVLDLVVAQAPPGFRIRHAAEGGHTCLYAKDFYFGGLDERRLLFSCGRDLDLAPKQDGPRVNLFIRAYVEVDGKPYSTFDRVLKFTELKQATSLAGATPSASGK